MPVTDHSLSLPSPADFVQVFYGYLENLESRQRKTLPISFVWDCEFLTQMVDRLNPGQRQGRLPSISNQRSRERDVLLSRSTVCNVSVASKTEKAMAS